MPTAYLKLFLTTDLDEEYSTIRVLRVVPLMLSDKVNEQGYASADYSGNGGQILQSCLPTSFSPTARRI